MIIVFFSFSLLFVDDNNVFTFIHVSDTHLSMDSTAVRNERFDVFTKTIVPMLSPELVVHSGDITDGWIEGTLCNLCITSMIYSWRNRR